MCWYQTSAGSRALKLGVRNLECIETQPSTYTAHSATLQDFSAVNNAASAGFIIPVDSLKGGTHNHAFI